MRVVSAIVLSLLVAAPGPGLSAGRPRPRVTRCCLEIPIPEVPPGPVCVQLRVGRRRIAPRLACRLLGGRPIGRGDCSLAACRPSTG